MRETGGGTPLGKGREPLNLQQKKDLRRQKIIDAAEALIRQTGTTDFSMQALAERAGFSGPTTYNLIGSKGTVFYILLNQYQDRVDFDSGLADADPNPFRQVLRATDLVIGLYTADSQFIRALMRYLLGIPDPVHRPEFMMRGYDYWIRAFNGLVEGGYLDMKIGLDALARDFLVYFSGALDMWVHEELSDEQLRLQSRCGAITRLLSLSCGENRDWLKQEFDDCYLKLEPIY